MSLLSDIQKLTERTYKSTGVNFEDYLIGRERFLFLSQYDQYSSEMPDCARVFFRISRDRLRVGIYYSNTLIHDLEKNDPRFGLSEHNIAAFCIFIEEINHAIHGALKFLEGHSNFGGEHFLRDLELQAKIDTYFVLKYFLAYFNRSKQLEALDRLWLRYHVFERGDFSYNASHLTERYREAVQLGEKYTRFIDALPSSERLKEIRQFRRLPYRVKRNYINLLP